MSASKMLEMFSGKRQRDARSDNERCNKKARTIRHYSLVEFLLMNHHQDILRCLTTTVIKKLLRVSKDFGENIVGYMMLHCVINIDKVPANHLKSLGKLVKRATLQKMESIPSLEHFHLTHLSFSDSFKFDVDGKLPETVTTLRFGNEFNRSVDKLPSSLQHLKFGIYFDQPLDNLPGSLLSLELYGLFKHTLDKLPASLLKLHINADFNSPVDHLPPKLEHLNLGYLFDQPVNNLPSSLITLSFGVLFSQPLDNLPSSLLYLSLGSLFNRPLDNLPPNLIYLRTGDNFNQPMNHLPESLRELHTGEDFNTVVDHLPKGLQRIDFGQNFNQPVENLPQSLSSVVFADSFNQSLAKLPSGVRNVCFLGQKMEMSLSTLAENVQICDTWSVYYDNILDLVKGRSFVDQSVFFSDWINDFYSISLLPSSYTRVWNF